MKETRIALKREYIRIKCSDWYARSMPDGYSYGGNQSWFKEPTDGAIAPLGCGLISCADILLYKTDRTRLDKTEYMEYVRSLNTGSLRVRKKLGVNGLSMAFGMRPLMKERGIEGKSRWCFSKGKQLERITEMIKNDTPVTISMGPCLCSKKKKSEFGVKFYVRDSGGNYVLPAWRSGLVKDHYVTVTAVVKKDGETYLEISSWGEKYYINWKEYVEYASLPRTFFSNIMLIR